MAKIQYILDGAVVPPPQNWKATTYELDFDRDEKRLDTGALVWLGDQAKKINDYVAAGVNGGVGILEGMPLKVEVCDTNEVLFDGYLDLADDEALFECDRVVAPAVEAGKIDWLNDVADSFSFAFLYEKGFITYQDFINVPYVISRIPDTLALLPLSVSLYLLGVEIFKTFKEIGITIADAVGGITGIAGAITYMVALLIYATLLIIAFVNLTQQFIDALIQKDKFKKGMLVRKHFSAACDYLGLQFSSSILNAVPYANLAIIPKKTVIPGVREANEGFITTSPEAYGHFDGTFGELIRQMQDVFNAKVTIIDDVLYFEREDFWNNISTFTIPPIEVEGVGTNMSELDMNYFMTFQVDEQDQNTLDSYKGTSVQITFTPAIQNNQNTSLMKGLNQKRLAFARGIEKKSLTAVEKAIQLMINNTDILYLALVAMFGALGFITSLVLGSYVATSFNVAYRINWLQLSNDFTGVQKLVLLDALGRVDPINFALTSADVLTAGFHRTLFPVDNVNNDHNQYERYEDRQVPMCCADFLKLKDNNVIKDSDGNFGKMESFKWNPFDEVAVVTYRIKKKITNNFVETKVVDGQQ